MIWQQQTAVVDVTVIREEADATGSGLSFCSAAAAATALVEADVVNIIAAAADVTGSGSSFCSAAAVAAALAADAMASAN